MLEIQNRSRGFKPSLFIHCYGNWHDNSELKTDSNVVSYITYITAIEFIVVKIAAICITILELKVESDK